jgi:hypothetical protein
MTRHLGKPTSMRIANGGLGPGGSTGAQFQSQSPSLYEPDYLMYYYRGEPMDYIRQSLPPMIGWFDYSSLVEHRKRRAFSLERGRDILDQSRAQGQSSVTDWTEDPFFMAILMGMAQRQLRHHRNSLQGKNPPRTTYRVSI